MKKVLITALLGSVGWLAHAQGRVGINTATPRAGLDVNHDDGIVATGGTNGNTNDLPTGTGRRLLWIPSRGAFRADTINVANASAWDIDNIGYYSVAFGLNAKATGSASMAIGELTTASGPGSVAFGGHTLAQGEQALATGWYTKASGGRSTTFGMFTTANNTATLAMGFKSLASGVNSVAMGNETTASGYTSLAAGTLTGASNESATAFGVQSRAEGEISTAMGRKTLAKGKQSTALGNETIALGENATALGLRTIASGKAATALGNETIASGEYSLAAGYSTYANGDLSTALGGRVTASLKMGAFVIGDASPVNQNTGSSADNKFTARFANGYLLYTSANLGSFTALPPNGNAWTSQSDSTKKTGFLRADGEAFLEKLRGLRLGSWNYKSQDARTMRHYGPMAQEFFAAYGRDGRGIIGTDTTLSTADVDGVAFILLQALEKRTAELQNRLAAAEARIGALTAGKPSAPVAQSVPSPVRRATQLLLRSVIRTEKQRWYDDDGTTVRKLR